MEMYPVELDSYEDKQARLKHLFILPTINHGNLTRYLNYSCKPNCRIERWYVDGAPRLAVYTERRIFTDQVLTVGYKIQDRSVHPFIACCCGSTSCKGYVK